MGSVVLSLSLQAVANESGLNFISVKGPELLNMVSCAFQHDIKIHHTLYNVLLVIATDIPVLLMTAGSHS